MEALKGTRSSICGSDLHLYNGNVPNTHVGMSFGQAFIGEVIEVNTPCVL